LATQQEEQQVSVSIKELLEAGAHFGHQTHRWNPKMKRYIFEERNGLYIIDLAKTLQLLRNATGVVREIVSKHRSILIVGTKKQAKDVVKELAEKCGEFYVCERWLGGMLTNLNTIRQSIKKLEKIEKKISTQAEAITKKELSEMTKLQIKLEKNLSGVRGMRKLPGLVIVVDPSKEHIAVAEANKLGIPVMGLVDTNCNPDPVQYVIPCNDDALKSIKLILEAITDAVIAQKEQMQVGIGKREDGEEDGENPPASKRLEEALASEEGE
jgi:small subunit ribosomal protein S2